MKFCSLLLCATLALASAVGPYNNLPKSNNFYGQHAQPTRAATPTYTKNNAHPEEVQTLRNDNEINADGSYSYAYETSNGIVGSESGIGGVAVQGSSSYISPEGIEIKLSYTADETGYHPVGDHIPKTPDYVYKALEYIRTHPPQKRDHYESELKVPTIIAPPVRGPAARKPAPVTRKPVPVTRKPVPVTRKPVPATRKPLPAARKAAPVAYKKPVVASNGRNQQNQANKKKY